MSIGGDPRTGGPVQPGDPYAAGHLRQALACDERVGEQDLQVDIVGTQVVISGSAASPERRRAIEEVAREQLPGWDVRVLVDVIHRDGPIEREELG